MLEQLGMCTQAAFGNRIPLTPAHIRELAATGIGWIEVGGPNPWCFNYDDDAFIDALVAAVHEPGVRAWSMHGPFCPISMDDPAERKRAVELLIRAGNIAGRFGVGRMVIHPGRDVPTVDLARELAWCREALSRALERIPESVTLAVETVPPPYLGMRCEDIEAIMEGFDPQRVGVCLDTGHWNMAGHLLESARTIAGRIATVHLHDSQGPKNDHLMPGDGTIDWPVLIETLRAGGYAGPLMLEARSAGTSCRDLVAECARRMTQFLRDT